MARSSFRKWTSGFAIVAMLAAVGLAGCVAGDGEGTAAVYVKDQPADDFEKVFVTFSKVEIHTSGDASENSTAGWIVLWEDAAGKSVDLKNYTGDAKAFLGSDNLTAGMYQQLRIHIDEAWGEDAEGERTDFTVPSGVLRTSGSFEVEADRTTHITLDYDLDQSILVQGNGNVTFRPVLGQVLVDVNDEEPESEEDGADA
jgi:hypothetical protein